MKIVKYVFAFVLAFVVVALAPHGARAATATSSPDGLFNCFDLYHFGSVPVTLQTTVRVANAGTNMGVVATISNQNDYPIVDGSVYIKVFKQQAKAANDQVNAGEVVDQFYALNNITLKAHETRSIPFEWTVPGYSVSGSYGMAPYFIVGGKFNLLGLSFTDDIRGQMMNFTLNGTQKGTVSFDKNTVTVNGDTYRFASFTPKFGKDSRATIVAELVNTTDRTQRIPTTAHIYSWDAARQQNLLEDVPQVVTLKAGERKKVTYTVNRSVPVTLAVIEADYNDAKSILNVRFSREGITNARINFPSIASYPVKAGEKNAIFSCMHSAGLVDKIQNQKLVLSLFDDVTNKLIYSYTYKGDITGAMMGAKSTFTPREDSGNLRLEAKILDVTDKVVDSYTMKYSCDVLNPNACAKNFFTTTDRAIVGAGLFVILLLIVGLFITKDKVQKDIVISLVLVVVVLGVIVVSKLANATIQTSVDYPVLPPNAVTWNNIFHINNSHGVFFQGDVNVSVAYGGYVKNTDTGSVINSGNTVPIGTHITYVPAPNNDNNIAWFATGNVFDSPFGYWSGNNSFTSCSLSDYVGNVGTGITLQNGDTITLFTSVFTPVTLNSFPSVSLVQKGTAGLTSTGGYNYTVTSAGTINTDMTFTQSANSGVIDFYLRTNDDPDLTAAQRAANFVNICTKGNIPLATFTVPPQTVNFSFTVPPPPGPVNHAPNAPTFTGPTSVMNDATNKTYTVSATDSDADQIHYLVDTRENSNCTNPIGDTWLPIGGGNVPSGTAQTFTRFWSTAGTKVMCAQTVDAQGLASAWTPISVVVTQTPPPTNNAPTAPVISGPTSPVQSYNATYGTMSTDPDGDAVYYTIQYLNFNGTVVGPDVLSPATNSYPSGTTGYVTKAFGTGGIQFIRAKATDVPTNGSTALSSAWTTYQVNVQAPSQPTPTPIPSASVPVNNHSPNTCTITGPATVDIGTTNTYTVVATDPDGDNIQYKIDINGDGSVFNYLPSANTAVTTGTSQTFAKSWNTIGQKTIYAWAKDINGAQSYPQCTIKTMVVTPPTDMAPSDPVVTGFYSINQGVAAAYNFTSVDPDGDNISYQVSLTAPDGNGNHTIDAYIPVSNAYPSGTQGSYSNTWNTPGVQIAFYVRAVDVSPTINGGGPLASNWIAVPVNVATPPVPSPTPSGSVPVNNHAPNAPVITGTTPITVGMTGSYNVVATDPDGDNVRYKIDINGDGSVFNYLPSVNTTYPSGTSVKFSQSWGTQGVKTIKALAYDANGASSGWVSYNVTVNPVAVTVAPVVIPGLSGSCSPTGTFEVGRTITWVATANGGNGTYTYAWGGGSAKDKYGAPGTYNKNVVITSGGISITVSCTPVTIPPIITGAPALGLYVGLDANNVNGLQSVTIPIGSSVGLRSTVNRPSLAYVCTASGAFNGVIGHVPEDVTNIDGILGNSNPNVGQPWTYTFNSKVFNSAGSYTYTINCSGGLYTPLSQTVSVSVVNTPNNAPTSPVISGANHPVISQPTSYSFLSTDADGDNIYYDVNLSGAIDTDGALIPEHSLPKTKSGDPQGGYTSGTAGWLTTTWNSAGTKIISARATDLSPTLHGNPLSSAWSKYTVVVNAANVPSPTPIPSSTVVPVTNHAPTIPTIGGPTTAKTNLPVQYTVVATDQDSDNIWYEIDMNCDSSYIISIPSNGSVPSGTSASFNQLWTSAGVKSMRARALDVFNYPGGWSACYNVTVTVPDLPIVPSPTIIPHPVVNPVGHAPNIPVVSGPITAQVGTPTAYSVVSSDSDGDNIWYYVDMNCDQGTILTLPANGSVPSGTVQGFNQFWSTAGVKYMRARALDVTGNSSNWSSCYQVNVSGVAPTVDTIPVPPPTIGGANNPPAAPTLSGLTTVTTGLSAQYSVVSTDPDGDNIYYNIDLLNNGNITQLPSLGTVLTGVPQSFYNSWVAAGAKIILAQAVDSFNNQSPWTAYPVTVISPVQTVAPSPLAQSDPTLVANQCSATANSYVTGQTVNWVASQPQGGNGTYTFSWSGGSASDVYNSPGTYNKTVTVTSGGQTATRACIPVTVVAAGTADVQLFVAKNAATFAQNTYVTQKSISIVAGSSLGLKSAITLPNGGGYICSASGAFSATTGHSSESAPNVTGATSAGTYSFNTQTFNTPGVYTYTVTCTDGITPKKSSATVTVTPKPIYKEI